MVILFFRIFLCFLFSRFFFGGFGAFEFNRVVEWFDLLFGHRVLAALEDGFKFRVDRPICKHCCCRFTWLDHFCCCRCLFTLFKVFWQVHRQVFECGFSTLHDLSDGKIKAECFLRCSGYIGVVREFEFDGDDFSRLRFFCPFLSLLLSRLLFRFLRLDCILAEFTYRVVPIFTGMCDFAVFGGITLGFFCRRFGRLFFSRCLFIRIFRILLGSLFF